MVTRQNYNMVNILGLSILQTSKTNIYSFYIISSPMGTTIANIRTSNTHINRRTASAVPWNHLLPASPGV